MSITDVQLVTRNGTLTSDGWEYVRTYRVESDDATEAISSVALASHGGISIPAYGTAHPDDSYAYLRNKQVDRDENDRTVWHVRATYRYNRRDTPEDDPLDDPATVDWGVRFIGEVVTQDINGAPIDNSAGEPFDPPLEQERPILTLTVVRNETTFDAAEAHSYAQTVNSDYTTIAGLSIAPHEGLCTAINGSFQERNGTEYYAVTYQFEFRPDTWDRDVLDVGMHYLDGGSLVPFTDGNGAPMQTPQLLNGSGGAGSTASFLTFETYSESNFGRLNLGGVG